MPDSFIDQREGRNKELKSKGRIEREMQWVSKVKGSSILQNISKGMANLWQGCVNLFYSQVGRDKLSLPELKKGTLVYSQTESSWQAIEYDYNNKSNKKQVKETVSNKRSELAFSLQLSG